MISSDQPSVFPASLRAAVSSRSDGNMKFGIGLADDVRINRHRFLEKAGIDPADTTLVAITYDTDDFAKYRFVSNHDKTVGMNGSERVVPADALVVDQPNHALFLPLADCVGAILYDPIRSVLMVSHLGRHSAEISGGKKSVDYLHINYDVNPADLLVWLSPAVGSATYPLHAFGGKGLHEVIVQQLKRAGVREAHIQVSSVNTAESDEYFSHSEFLKGRHDVQGRFAIVAMMTEQGEPAV